MSGWIKNIILQLTGPSPKCKSSVTQPRENNNKVLESSRDDLDEMFYGVILEEEETGEKDRRIIWISKVIFFVLSRPAGYID